MIGCCRFALYHPQRFQPRSPQITTQHPRPSCAASSPSANLRHTLPSRLIAPPIQPESAQLISTMNMSLRGRLSPLCVAATTSLTTFSFKAPSRSPYKKPLLCLKLHAKRKNYLYRLESRIITFSVSHHKSRAICATPGTRGRKIARFLTATISSRRDTTIYVCRPELFTLTKGKIKFGLFYFIYAIFD